MKISSDAQQGRSPRFCKSHGCSTGKGSFSNLRGSSREAECHGEGPQGIGHSRSIPLSGRLSWAAAGRRRRGQQVARPSLPFSAGFLLQFPAHLFSSMPWQGHRLSPWWLLHAGKTWSIFFERCNRLQAVCLLQLLPGQPPEQASLSFGVSQ